MKQTQREQDKKQVGDIETKVAIILTKTEYIQNEIIEIKTRIEKDYVTRDQFEPVQRIVYGIASTILVAVVTAVVYLVIKK